MKPVRVLLLIIVLSLVAAWIALPNQFYGYKKPQLDFIFWGRRINPQFELKQGLDIQGGIQVVLDADMTQIAEEDRETALEASKQVIQRRVDLYGISEPVVQTSKQGENYRLIVELAGMDDPQQALDLIGTTAQLDFRLQTSNPLENPEATPSAATIFDAFEPTGLTGQQLKRANLTFDQRTGEPTVGIEFNPEGRDLFAELTQNNVNQVLAIFLDDVPLMFPTIQTPILDGKAVISGSFSVEEAKNMSIQLNAGAMPVPIKVVEQKTVGASLGRVSVQKSIQAGLIGIGLVMVFMILYYGFKGFLASLALVVYAVLTVALYKLLGVTLTLPGIAGLLLSIGMAVDANILIFERMKEELRDGQAFARAMELGFGRAWDSIKDANLATISTALILVNPFDFSFLNSSGLVRGFGITLLIGVIIGLFTGIVVTRTLMRVFLRGREKV